MNVLHGTFRSLERRRDSYGKILPITRYPLAGKKSLRTFINPN